MKYLLPGQSHPFDFTHYVLGLFKIKKAEEVSELYGQATVPKDVVTKLLIFDDDSQAKQDKRYH